MLSKFIHLKLIGKNNIKQSKDKIFKLLKISLGDNVSYLRYKKKSSNQSFVISYYKKFIKKNIGKMEYAANKNKEIEIFNKIFLSKNIKRAKIIINNK